MKKGAIFDMDGLMFDTESMYQKVWREMAEEQGIHLPIEFTKEICGTNGDLLNSIVVKYYHTDNPQALFQRCFSEVAEQLKQDVPVKPGLFEILSFFNDSGVKLAVASSSKPEMIRSNLRVSKTNHFFDAVVSGAELEHGKPEPDIFLLAAEQIGIDPKDCYVFEDSINGVLAGLAAGCTTIMVPDYIEPNDRIRNSDAHICVSLSEAMDKISHGLI